MKQQKLWKWMTVFFLLIVSALFSLYLGGITSFEELLHKLSRKPGVIASETLTPRDYIKDGNRYTSTSNDAGFYTGTIHQYVNDVTITFANPLPSDIEIQLYYANTKADMGSNTPASARASQGQTSVLLTVDDDVEHMRIDITTQAGQSFALKDVTFNTNGYFGFLFGNFTARTLIIWCILVFIAAHFMCDRRKMYAWLEKNRFLLGAGFVVFCVIFELHGSSIAWWAKQMPSNVDALSDTLFGVPRAVRTDEWGVFTPMAISQSFGEAPYSWFGEILRGTTTDMFMVYGQPVATPFMIFRPFLIGFLLFGTSRGLAFFWSARLAALFLVSYEFFKMITKSKKFAVTAAVMMTWAPLVQWWFAINGLVEMLVFAQLSLIMLKKYMCTDVFWKRCICLLVIALCAGGFILTLYPAWQVPVFYIILACALGIILENYKQCKISGRDIASIGIAAAGLALCFGFVFYRSWDTVQLVLNTAYPGNRVNVGGVCEWTDLFRSWGNIFFPAYSEGIPVNACESAMFTDLFPIGIVLSIYLLIKTRKKDFLSIFLLIVSAIMAWYALFGFPEILAKLTGLSLSGGDRVLEIWGIVNILLLFRSLCRLEFKMPTWAVCIVSCVFAAIVSIASKIYYGDYVNVGMVVIITVLSAVIAFSLFKNLKKIFFVLMIVAVMVGGLCVNPVQRGVGVIYQFPLAKTLSEMEENHPGKWAALHCSYPITNYLMMYGLPCVNSTNIYPSFETWEKLDTDGVYEDIYNRYAHIELWLSQDTPKEKFELLNPDVFKVYTTIDELKKIGVKYVFSPEKLNKYVLDETLRCLDFDGNYFIYEIIR